MNRSIIACSVLSAVLLSAPVNAGWLDSVTKKEVAPVATQAAAVTGLADNALVGNVMSQLGLTEQQAAGGLGSILNLAQSNLGNNDFSTLSNSIPGIDSILGAAPTMGGDSGVSGLLSKAGNLGSSLQGAAVVYDSFEKLGISKEYIAPMVDIAKQYLQQQSGEGTVDLLIKGLGSLL